MSKKTFMGTFIFIAGLVLMITGIYFTSSTATDASAASAPVEPSPGPWDIVCDSKGNHTFLQEDGKPWIDLFPSREIAEENRDSRKRSVEKEMEERQRRAASGEMAQFRALYDQVTTTKWKRCE